MRVVKTYDCSYGLLGFPEWVEDNKLIVRLVQRGGGFIATLKDAWGATGATVEETPNAREDTICQGTGTTEYLAVHALGEDISGKEVVFFNPGRIPYKLQGEW